MLATFSRGAAEPKIVSAPDQRAINAERAAPWKSTATSYLFLRTSRRAELICFQVCAEDIEERHALVFTTCNSSTSGREDDRGPELVACGLQSNSCQRSSTTQPMRVSGNAWRKAVAAGNVWIMSPIAPRRTIKRRSILGADFGGDRKSTR